MDTARNTPRVDPQRHQEPTRHVQYPAKSTDPSFTVAHQMLLNADVLTAVAELLEALPDPAAEVELWRQLVREAYERGCADGWRQGYAQADADMARNWQEIASPIARGGVTHAELEKRRWGLGGRAHFGDPQPGDRFPEPRLEAAAS